MALPVRQQPCHCTQYHITVCRLHLCAGLAALLQMLCTDFNRSHPEQSAACKQMAKAAWNWAELLTGMLLWQHRELPLIRLKDLVNAAVRIRGQPRHTDLDFQDFFHEVGVVVGLCVSVACVADLRCLPWASIPFDAAGSGVLPCCFPCFSWLYPLNYALHEF